MSGAVHLSFPAGIDPFANVRVHRVELVDVLNEPFSVAVELTSSDPAVEPRSVVGHDVVVTFADEPFLTSLRGIVKRCRQKSSVTTAGDAASAYEVVIVPPLWLLGRASRRRIHQNRTPAEVVGDTLAIHGAGVPQAVVKLTRPPRVYEYRVQYDESDLEFVRRVLADDHLSSFFDPTREGAWTITDDLSSAAAVVPVPLVYKPPTDLLSSAPHVLHLIADAEIGTGALSIRDYDPTHPQLSRGVPVSLTGDASTAAPFDKQVATTERFAVGRFSTEEAGDDIAGRDLAGESAALRAIHCELNFAVAAGSKIVVTDHPRRDVQGELICISSHVTIDDGLVLPGAPARTPVRRYRATFVRAQAPFAPAPVPRPRLQAPEPAFVVGEGPDGSVDCDRDGRVLVEFVWDRRDLRRGSASRRVRVSQAWAGTHHGIMTLPRIGDEVLIDYLAGNPDEPIVVGRVHNAVAIPPLDLPEPDRTLSVWRSRTIGGDGYNLVLMDDAPGGERLWLRAERDYRLHVRRNATELIDGDATRTIGGDARVEVRGQLSVDTGGYEHTSGPFDVRATSVSVKARDELAAEADVVRIEAGSKIELVCGGSKLVLEPGGATLTAPRVTLDGSTVTIKGSSLVDVDGALITLN